MKKILILILITVLLAGCGNGFTSEDYPPAETENDSSLENNEIIIDSGNTLETRIAVPEGYVRMPAEEGSLTAFLRSFEMKDNGSPVLLYDGSEKGNQNAHAAVFALPIENVDLQQCADSVMRIFAEYYRSCGQDEKIAFHFTDGFLCEYSKWKEGYRVAFNSNGTVWQRSASYDDSYECFVKYLRMVFSYAGTASMEAYEAETISLSEMNVGDVILKGGSPGHVVMVADICENEKGQKAYLLAQGYMPAQEFHIINNPTHDKDPWYYQEEISFPLQTAEYTFTDESAIKKLSY